MGILVNEMAYDAAEVFIDPYVKLELLLASVLSSLDPAEEDFQEGGASSEGGDAGEDAAGDSLVREARVIFRR